MCIPPISRPKNPLALPCLAAIALSACLAAPAVRAEGQDSGSTQLVKQLVDQMTQRQLTAIATRHPKEPDRYVAAMLFPGVQLLLVSARSSSPAYIESQLSAGGDAAVYGALHHGVPDGKVFIQDMGCDGLRGGAGGLADVIYTDGKNERILDGDYKAAKLSKAAYAKLLDQTEAEYSALLGGLIEAVKARSASPGTR